MTPPTDNPWKKRRQGPQEFMPPCRALYAEDRNGHKATATWAFQNGEWKCIAASGFLKWTKGWIINPKIDCRFKSRLADLGIGWHWIQPNTVRVLAPPF